MRYPRLKTIQKSRDIVSEFRGYNHNLRIGDGEFFDMENMTSDFYPVLSPRRKRGVYTSPAGTSGLISKDSLCYVDGTDFVINEYHVDMGLNNEPKSLVSMGAYVIILPDKKWINTLNLTEYGSIDAEMTTTSPVTFSLCRVDGEAYTTEFVQATEPEAPENMAVWVDTSSVPHVLKQWSESSGLWVNIATTYVKIACTGIGLQFEQYDGITIDGLDGTLHDGGGAIIADDSQLKELEGSAVVWDKGDDYIVVIGILDSVVTVSDPITVSRKMPYMDYVIESGNRLWGCRYGPSASGEIVNEIYASKLGDFKNWNCYMGIATDSYTASCGTDGQFTGAVTHLGYPIFFKETCMHKVYGNYPSNIKIQDTACRGVQHGCSKSLAIVNETLFYKARSGVCAYDGSLPVEISAQLGDKVYRDAVAGSHGNKYYISMKDDSGIWNLFVYDTKKGMWHKEDSFHADDFCSCRGELYAIDHDTKKIITMLGSGEADASPVKWMVETGYIGLNSPDMKYVSSLTIRMSMELAAEVRILVQYDFNPEWDIVYSMRNTRLRSFSIPIRPRRCDFMRLRIEGEGQGKVFSLTKTTAQGSDLS